MFMKKVMRVKRHEPGRLRRLSLSKRKMKDCEVESFGNTTGGSKMWMKDSNGNWFMAGQEIIMACNTPKGCWIKDSAGSWVLSSETHGRETNLPEVKLSEAERILAGKAV
jgi:hypothetical protein